MTLDTNSTVWTFWSWGRPFQLISPLLDCSSPETTPIQIKCGWGTCIVLMESGDVYMWGLNDLHLGDLYDEAMKELDKDESTKATVPDGGTVIPCHTWGVDMDPIKLPILPDLPDLPETRLPEEECRKETKLIKIAALVYTIIGLTNKGHVLVIDRSYLRSTRVWCYVGETTWIIWHPFLNHDTQLPNYSEIDKVKKHPAFHITTDNDGWERPPQVELSSDTMLITHVSDITSMSSEFCV